MKPNRNPLYEAVQFALAAGVGLGLAGTSSVAFAQDEDEDSAELDRLEVTGSRIRRTDIEGASPIFVIQREDIERTGLTSVGDLLQDLPVAGAALNTQFNNGGNGATYLDLRNLGSNRLLILVNGRRWVTSLGGRVDLNDIPVSVVKRIEVLKDGASAIYGSDAIAGVVNIITRDDFEGAQVNGYLGQYDDNDGEIQFYDVSLGTASDRGSVFLNVSYAQQEPVFAGDRRISAEPQFGTGNAFGSSGTPQGRFGGLIGPEGAFVGGYTTDPGADVTALGASAFRAGDFSFGAPGDGGDRFNFAPDNYLLTPYERTNVYVQGRYDITDDITLSIEGTYNQRKSDQLLAPTPLFLGLFGSGFAAGIGVDAENPFNPFGIDLPASSWLLGRRMVEAGPRQFFQDVDNWRFGAGLEGSFQIADRYFDWDVNYVYGDRSRNDFVEGRLNLQRVADGLSAGCVDGSIPGCVPFNVFGGQGTNGTGTMTREMLDYVLYTEQSTRGNTLRNYNANITGEIVELPAGPLGFAAGLEYRQEEGFDLPDALVASGITSGNARQPTSGDFSLDEFYIEFAIPLLAGVTGAERLDLSVAARRSDYDTFGSTNNFKVGLEWQPISDLLVRGTWSEGFRAPSISELFAGQGDSFPTITDPCSDMLGLGGGVPASQSIINNCVAVGVPADGSYVQANAQIRITVGSNPNLQPELSESFTLGFVYSPSWLDGLDITIDYYDIEITNSITSVGAQTILNACANNLALCNLIQRSSRGIVTDLLNAGVNIGGNDVKGVDALFTYSFPETQFGFFRAALDIAYQSDNLRIVEDPATGNTQEIQRIGFDVGDGAFARVKSTLDINWSYGDWDATYGLQYIHGLRESCGIPAAFGFCNLVGSGDPNDASTFDQRRIGGTTYHDLQVSYHLSNFDTRVTLGVDNIWDKGPPLSTAAFANSFNAADYRTPGRFPYLRITTDF